MADNLKVGERCAVTVKGKIRYGRISAVLPKRYLVLFHGETEAQPFSKKKVKPHKLFQQKRSVTGHSKRQTPLLVDDVLSEPVDEVAREQARQSFDALMQKRLAQQPLLPSTEELYSIGVLSRPGTPEYEACAAGALDDAKRTTCTSCGQLGHWSPDCPELRPAQKKISQYRPLGSPICDILEATEDITNPPFRQVAKGTRFAFVRKSIGGYVLIQCVVGRRFLVPDESQHRRVGEVPFAVQEITIDGASDTFVGRAGHHPPGKQEVEDKSGFSIEGIPILTLDGGQFQVEPVPATEVDDSSEPESNSYAVNIATTGLGDPKPIESAQEITIDGSPVGSLGAHLEQVELGLVGKENTCDSKEDKKLHIGRREWRLALPRVYALIDPSTREIRYIGSTTHGTYSRLDGHIKAASRGGKRPVCVWVRALLERGLKPEIKVLYEAKTPVEARRKEKICVQHLLSRGVPLLNVTFNKTQGSTNPLTPVPKPAKPLRSKVYLDYVRGHDCCNCGTPGPSDPDHVGSRGVGQKCSDLFTVPLCRRCHQTRTDKNVLPDPETGGLRDANHTLYILLQAQVRLLAGWVEKTIAETKEHRSWICVDCQAINPAGCGTCLSCASGVSP